MIDTGTEQCATVAIHVNDPFARLRERLRIQSLTDTSDPDYLKRTRQLLEQLDEYPSRTPCLVVSFEELRALLGTQR